MLKLISRPRIQTRSHPASKPMPVLAFVLASGLFYIATMTTHAVVARADVPVYLKSDSRFPSGLHPRGWLESQTTETQVQRWFRVVSGKNFGWVAEDHVLSQLKLSSIARTIREEPDRSAPQMDSLRTTRIPKSSQVIVLEVLGSWSRIRVLSETALNHDSWILNDALVRDQENQIQRGVTFKETPLRLGPSLTKAPHDRLPAFRDVSVLNTVKVEGITWVEIQVDSGSVWIDRKNIWLAQDLGPTTLRPLQAGLELRSAPLPNADIVLRLTGTESLKIVDSKYLRWGKVKVPEHGLLWWPISEDKGEGSNAIPPLKLTTQDLVGRNIYDMALSPSVPGLRFASARGVFRSRDGIEWSLIPEFESDNYPIAVAKSGLLFVGPYVSTDHGEKFEQWIRWDRLVETIKRGTGSPPAKLRLNTLKTVDTDGNSLHLVLDVGRSKPVRIGTTDRGLNWKIL